MTAAAENITLNAGSAELAHGSLSFLEAGRGRPLLFMHGVNGNARSWLPQLQGLARHFRVIAWNAPGYDTSSPVCGDMAAFAQAGFDLLDALDCHQPVIIGHSLGGVIAMKMLTMQPRRFTHAVLSCTHPGYAKASGDVLMDRYRKRVAELENLSREEYGRRRALRMLPPDATPDVVEKLAEVAASANPRGLEAAMRALATANLAPELSDIRIPTLVLTCDRDPVVSLERSRPVFEGIPGAYHLRLPGLGHAPYYENPELYNGLLTLFLGNSRTLPS